MTSNSCSAREGARLLSLAPRTLSRWLRRLFGGSSVVTPPGRPKTAQFNPEQKQAVLDFLDSHGTKVSLNVLRGRFPELPRCRLKELLHEERKRANEGPGRRRRALTWKTAGRVWAMDFTELPEAMDGQFRHVMVIKDLASRAVLRAIPVESPTASVTRWALQDLFEGVGRPLVIKSDNGSAFICDEIKSWLRTLGVVQLFSPPRMPRYNGAVERSIGLLKKRMHNRSIREGRPGFVLREDLFAATYRENHLNRPWGWNKPTPWEAFEKRLRVESGERLSFKETLRAERTKLLEELRDIAKRDDRSPLDEASLNRKAISRALVQCGYLEFRRGRITTVI
jgi:transposase InsO family protein